MPSEPKILTKSQWKWCELATKVIGTTVKMNISAKDGCSMMLTGSKTAIPVLGNFQELESK
jgi:hypothetical protein